MGADVEYVKLSPAEHVVARLYVCETTREAHALSLYSVNARPTYPGIDFELKEYW